MIKLEIIAQPKSNKYLEFSQSLEFIKFDLMKLCRNIEIIEESMAFSLVANLDSNEQLIKILHSKELEILSGAINTLGENSEIIINGSGNITRGSNLRAIRLVYPKIKKEKVS